ncbi:hypothetical protein [Streptomyces sp. NPDC058280]|uniref:hypothetical protein n=1 Tax=Streptomyces sp. NPDC058280 TaxID=3346419 RepID=UPI0036E95126
MPETTHPTQQDEGLRRARTLPEPSYAAQLITAFADQLDVLRPTATLTHRTLGVALAIAAARTLGALPTAVQGAAASRALTTLPQLAIGERITCGEYAIRLRAAAQEV